jgi:hypothetical protein
MSTGWTERGQRMLKLQKKPSAASIKHKKDLEKEALKANNPFSAPPGSESDGSASNSFHSSDEQYAKCVRSSQA